MRQMSRQVVLSATKVQMSVMVLPHPLVAENLGAFSVNNFFYITSPQISFERVVDNGFSQSYQAVRGDQVHPHSNKSKSRMKD